MVVRGNGEVWVVLLRLRDGTDLIDVFQGSCEVPCCERAAKASKVIRRLPIWDQQRSLRLDIFGFHSLADALAADAFGISRDRAHDAGAGLSCGWVRHLKSGSGQVAEGRAGKRGD